MSVFIYNGSRQDIKDAVILANEIYDEVVAEIKKSSTFEFVGKTPNDLTGLNGLILADELKRFKKEGKQIEVKTYWYYNGNVMGYYSTARPFDVNLNRKALPRKIWSLISTLFHELTHALDIFHDLYFGHGDNYYKRWKESTAPFFVDAVAEKIAMGKVGITRSERTDNTQYKRAPLWHRVLFFWRYL